MQEKRIFFKTILFCSRKRVREWVLSTMYGRYAQGRESEGGRRSEGWGFYRPCMVDTLKGGGAREGGGAQGREGGGGGGEGKPQKKKKKRTKRKIKKIFSPQVPIGNSLHPPYNPSLTVRQGLGDFF